MNDAFVLMNAALVRTNDAFVRTNGGRRAQGAELEKSTGSLFISTIVAILITPSKGKGRSV
jgi:hypothetical protein